jgi:hypothetical protein
MLAILSRTSTGLYSVKGAPIQGEIWQEYNTLSMFAPGRCERLAAGAYGAPQPQVFQISSTAVAKTLTVVN